MCRHEDKKCPRCQELFECKAGSITQCQCTGIQLTAEERVYVESRFEDCLCISCLYELRQEYMHFKEKYVFGT